MRELEVRTKAEQVLTRMELRALSSKIDALSRSFDNMQQAGHEDTTEIGSRLDVSDVEVAADGIAIDPSDLVRVFSQIADDLAVVPAEFVAVIKDGLKSSDAEVRAAAGRALCVADPVIARELLPSAIATETVRFAASTLRGALRAAMA